MVIFDSCSQYEQPKSDAHDLKQIFACSFSPSSLLSVCVSHNVVLMLLNGKVMLLSVTFICLFCPLDLVELAFNDE